MEFDWRLGFLLLAGSLCVSCVESDADTGNTSYEAKASDYSTHTTRSATYAPTYGGYGNDSYAYSQAYSIPWPSPWKTTPGTYSKDAYGGNPVYGGRGFSAHNVYASYLSSSAYQSYSSYCTKSYGGQYPKISYDDLRNAFAYALHELGKYNQLGGQYTGHGGNSSGGAGGYGGNHWAQTNYLKEREAMFMEYASLYLVRHHCLSSMDINYILPQVKIGGKTGYSYADQACYSGYGSGGGGAGGIRCVDSKYRSVDGSCNNLYHAYWGKAQVCHLRLVPAAYADGLHLPRVGSYGKELPGAREVSSYALPDITDRAYYTHLKMQFGQYINHDITLTPTTQSDYASGVMIQCCPKSYHPQCYPIRIPVNDYYQGKYKRTCMNFVRSAPCPLCTLGPRNQVNDITSFIDQSGVYGSDPYTAHRLRTHKYGLMKTGRDKYGHEILPPTNNPWQGGCWPQYQGLKCFDGGDLRINQHPGIMHLHLVYLRRHNMHARALYKVNYHWTDEKLYQEARRLTIAELQYITYNEYLGIVLGPKLMDYFSLHVNHGYSYYEPHTDPTTWNDYAAAACRFGHSQIYGTFSLIGNHGIGNYTYGGYKNNSVNAFLLKDWFHDPTLMHEGWHDQVIQGLCHDHAQVVDPWLTNAVKNYLFKPKKQYFGDDLAATNIQRGRDHGLPAYHVYLEFCFGFKAYSWADLGKFIPYYQLQILKSIYGEWRNVDVWVGGLSERHHLDADVGPTFACILGIQYYHLKFGDRYFVTHGGQTGSFSPAQLASIRHTATLSHVLCATSDYIYDLQKYAFFPASSYNPRVPCKSRPEIDYSLWKEAY